MKTNNAIKVTMLDRRPTTDDPCGTYKIIKEGIYWGHWYVGINWCNDKFVAEADPMTGHPW